MKIYLTKYALTTGVKVMEVKPVGDDDNMVNAGSCWYLHYPRDYAKSAPEALTQVYAKIAAARKSVEKKLKKLDKLTNDIAKAIADLENDV